MQTKNDTGYKKDLNRENILKIARDIFSKYGFKKTLIAAYVVLASGYFVMGRVSTYPSVFLVFLWVALGAGLFKDILPEGGEALAALTSAGGVLIIGISLKLLALKDVKVGNFLPALVIAPALVGLVMLFR